MAQFSFFARASNARGNRGRSPDSSGDGKSAPVAALTLSVEDGLVVGGITKLVPTARTSGAITPRRGYQLGF